MEAYSKLDWEIFDEFAGEIKGLRCIAAEIKAISDDPTLHRAVNDIEDDETAGQPK